MKKRTNPEQRLLNVNWRIERWIPSIRFSRATQCPTVDGMVIEPLVALRKRSGARGKVERNFKISSVRNGTRQTWR